jgi:hypothetical protein
MRRFSLWSRLLAPYRWLVLLLFLCQVGQSVAALLLPSLSADIIDRGILKDDQAYILRMSAIIDRKSTRLNSSHRLTSRMPSSA